MPIDANIILSGRAPQIDNPMDTMNRALSMKQLIQQNRKSDREESENEAVRNAFAKNVVTDETGKQSLNRKGVLSDLYKANPAKAMETEVNFNKMDQEEKERQFQTLNKQVQTAKQLAWSITDEASYQQARETGLRLGLPNADKLPPQYDPNLVKRMQMGTLNAEEQLAQQWKQKDYEQKNKMITAKNTAAQSKAGKMSPTQAKQLGLYDQGIEAEQQYKTAVGKKGWNSFDPTSSFQIIDKADERWYDFAVPQFLKSDESKEAYAAQSRWVEAFLRDASGAAIPPEERIAYAKDFFPRAGDSDQQIKDKERAREVKMNSARRAAGPGVDFSSPNDIDKLGDDDIDKIYAELGGQ